MAKQAKNKLKNVNVPELFFQHFLKDKAQSSPLIAKIAGIAPTPRGRGFSRVIEEVTELEWNTLYELAVDARGQMSGADRETVLRAAICAKAMAERMEKAGVVNPQPFVATRTRKPKSQTAPAPAATSNPVTTGTVDALNTMAEDATETEDTDLSSVVVPKEPATLDTADDVPASTDEELDSFGTDISYG